MTASISCRLCGLLALAALVGAGAASAPAQGKKSDSVVAVKAKADPADDAGVQVVQVTLKPAKGWHVYANPVGSADFEDNRTVVAVVGHDAKVTYPPGKPIEDKVVGAYRVYEEAVTIKAVVRREKGDAKPLEVTVKLQACSDNGRCLLPSTVKVSVD